MADAQTNRRRSPRLPVNSVAQIVCRKGLTGLGSNLFVSAHDISETGMRVVLREPVDAGQRMEVLISNASIAKPIRREARVIWTTALGDNQTAVGFWFDKPIPYADVQRFGA